MKKFVIINGQKLTRTKAKNSILKVWNNSTELERFDWYKSANKSANKIAVKKFGKMYSVNDVNKIIGIIAALSPLKEWNQNLKLAESCFLSGNFSQGHIKQFMQKAENIYKCSGRENEILEILNGQKISAFFLNIKYPENDIQLTIDRHAMCIACGLQHVPNLKTAINKEQYIFIDTCFRHVAACLGVSGLLLQSATWLAHKRLKQPTLNKLKSKQAKTNFKK